jgi:hypothetical protein
MNLNVYHEHKTPLSETQPAGSNAQVPVIRRVKRNFPEAAGTNVGIASVLISFGRPSNPPSRAVMSFNSS